MTYLITLIMIIVAIYYGIKSCTYKDIEVYNTKTKMPEYGDLVKLK